MSYRLWTCAWMAALAILSDSPGAAAQGSGRSASIFGRIVDQSGGVVPQAAIVVRRLATGVEQRTESNAEGAFLVADLPPGDYEVVVENAGFATAVQRVTLEGREARVDFRLLVGGLTEDVVIVAGELAGSHDRLRRLPGSVDVIGREALERSRVMTTNEALRQVAGVSVRDEEGFGLRPNIGIRGVNPTRSPTRRTATTRRTTIRRSTASSASRCSRAAHRSPTARRRSAARSTT
jgi:Fe(3+) dicitrate transport protein